MISSVSLFFFIYFCLIHFNRNKIEVSEGMTIYSYNVSDGKLISQIILNIKCNIKRLKKASESHS